MSDSFQYFAFISYSSKDIQWGRRLQRKLEHYRLPSILCSEHGWKRYPMKPIFFAPTDIQPGALSEEIKKRLSASQHLIVICSPDSAQSDWVGRELAFFYLLGRAQNIHFFIIDGIPNSGNKETECFNPVVRELYLPEYLGANVHEKVYRSPRLNRERAYVQLISKLLGVEFDTIWHRHRRLMVQKVLTWIIGVLVVLTALIATWQVNQPFNMEVRLSEESQKNDNLPPLQDAVVCITLDNETKIDTVSHLDTHITFTNIPHRFLYQNVYISIRCPNCIDLDTTLPLNKATNIGLKRDPDVYGNFCFRLWDSVNERVFPRATVVVEGHTVTADDDGYFWLSLPLAEQRLKYHVTGTNPIVDDTIIVPCGPNAVVIVK